MDWGLLVLVVWRGRFQALHSKATGGVAEDDGHYIPARCTLETKIKSTPVRTTSHSTLHVCTSTPLSPVK